MTGRSRAIPPILFEEFDDELHLIISTAIELMEDQSVLPQFAFDDEMRITSTHYSGCCGRWDVNVSIGGDGGMGVWINLNDLEQAPYSTGLSVDADARWPAVKAAHASSARSRLKHIAEIMARRGRQRPDRLADAVEGWRKAKDILSAWSRPDDSRRIHFRAAGPWGPADFTLDGIPVNDATSKWLISDTPPMLLLRRKRAGGWRLDRNAIVSKCSEIAVSIPEAMRIMTKYPEAFR